MRRLIKVTFSIAVFLATIVTLTLVQAHNQAPLINTARLQFTGCVLPCLAGLTVGQTTHEEAKREIEKVFEPAGYALTRGVMNDDIKSLIWVKTIPAVNTSDALTADFDQNNLMRFKIEVALNEPMLSLGEAVVTFGLPSCVSVDRQNRQGLKVSYINKKFMLQISTSSMLPSSTITGIDIEEPQYANCEDMHATPWHGLFDIDRYILYR